MAGDLLARRPLDTRPSGARLQAHGREAGPEHPHPPGSGCSSSSSAIGRGECVDEVAAVVNDADRLVRDAAIRHSPTTPTRRR